MCLFTTCQVSTLYWIALLRHCAVVWTQRWIDWLGRGRGRRHLAKGKCFGAKAKRVGNVDKRDHGPICSQFLIKFLSLFLLSSSFILPSSLRPLPTPSYPLLTLPHPPPSLFTFHCPLLHKSIRKDPPNISQHLSYPSYSILFQDGLQVMTMLRAKIYHLA